MRRVITSLAALGLLGAVLGCHHTAGMCDCDLYHDPCAGYGPGYGEVAAAPLPGGAAIAPLPAAAPLPGGAPLAPLPAGAPVKPTAEGTMPPPADE